MVLLFDIPFDDLKMIPSMLISQPVDSSDHCGFVFHLIGCVKSFHKEEVCSMSFDQRNIRFINFFIIESVDIKRIQRTSWVNISI